MMNDATSQNPDKPTLIADTAPTLSATTVPSGILTPLGHIPLVERTFSEDLQVSDRYQNFSAEILRLALLGVAGIGFLVANILLKSSSSPTNLAGIGTPTFKYLMSASLVCLGLSAAGALLHRYFSADSLACILLSLRLDLRGTDSDKIRAKEEKRKRDLLFKWSGRMLFASGAFLWFGAISLALSFIFGIIFP